MITKNKDMELIEFNSDGKFSSGVFSAKNKQSLKDLKANLKIATLNNLIMKTKGNNLNFSFGAPK